MNTRLIKAIFAGTIFASAFLLFLVQPLIAKQILPWFGGSAAVWTVCLVFFQVTLLVGYAYADWITRRLRTRTQALLQMALLLASLGFLPIITSARWKPAGTEEPTLWILGLLVTTIGLPYFLLSTTSPLLQSWLARTAWGAQVYRYFALSNLASLASLLAYPVLIEPYWALRTQAWAWSIGYGVFVLLCAATMIYLARHAAQQAEPRQIQSTGAGDAPGAPPRAVDYLLWLAFPALASWLLLAITNHITQNVAPVPFLWVLPLSVYLLTFVLTFDNDRWYHRPVVLPVAAALLALCAFGLQHSIGWQIETGVPLYIAGLFVFCMFLHGEMARRRPDGRYLTRFYLMLSLGGAVGGVTVGLIAPRVLPAYYELGIGLVLTALAGATVLRSSRILAWSTLGLAGFCSWFLALQVHGGVKDVRRMTRNFYGTLLTVDSVGDTPADDVRKLFHGSVKHGQQYLSAARRREPTSYYGPESGVGRAIEAAPQRPRRVGVIGLGAGTLAAYGRSGDVYRLYEINPQVIELAGTEFSFLADSAARIEQVLGDARLALEREAPQAFDVLAVDAFSGDSVPIHLITAEAMDVYWRHMAADGVVAFHVTNHYLALAPVVEKVAHARGLHAVLVHDDAVGTDFRQTDWMLVARDAQVLARDPIRHAASALMPIPGLQPWTDDFNNLFGVLK
ncbi:spermidine synthase [Variovorax sp. OV329]|uniref:spermidine synthase n=1 Tax=Variovorax sp. OV329 TaxID=1882825 RepID=UPI0008F0065B|nr:fused MFS/spermidine synthase [Variovorax sp. OV329]SFN34959.1 hypothetical protein SAMN05444747_12283 [Variovorax sp. OV329]